MQNQDSLSSRCLAFIEKLVLLRKTCAMIKKRHTEINCYFWCINSLHILGESRRIDRLLPRKEILSFITMCHNSDGGFGASVGLKSDISATLCALQLTILLGEWQIFYKMCPASAHYVQSLYVIKGFYTGHLGGEPDIQHTYCALYCIYIMRSLHLVDKEAISTFLCKCLNVDGGVGNLPECESHSGQIFCLLASLSILGTLDTSLTPTEQERIARWLANRQNLDGGLCGRPNKKSDSCYSWWVCASLSMLSKQHWIDVPSLYRFLEKCEGFKGGFADKPYNNSDPYHTFFTLAGMSVSQMNQVLCDPLQCKISFIHLSSVFAVSKNLEKSFYQ